MASHTVSASPARAHGRRKHIERGDELPLTRDELLSALARDMERSGDWTHTAETNGCRVSVTRELAHTRNQQCDCPLPKQPMSTREVAGVFNVIGFAFIAGALFAMPDDVSALRGFVILACAVSAGSFWAKTTARDYGKDK